MTATDMLEGGSVTLAKAWQYRNRERLLEKTTNDEYVPLGNA